MRQLQMGWPTDDSWWLGWSSSKILSHVTCRRDHVLQQCMTVKAGPTGYHWATFHGESCVWSSRPVVAVGSDRQARSDAGFWRDRLNGELMTEQILADRMEVPAVAKPGCFHSETPLARPGSFYSTIGEKHIYLFSVYFLYSKICSRWVLLFSLVLGIHWSYFQFFMAPAYPGTLSYHSYEKWCFFIAM